MKLLDFEITRHDSFVHEPAVPVVSVALADGVFDYARAKFLELLLFLVGDDGQPERAEREGRDLAAECVAAAKPGIWLLYAEMFSGRRADAAAYAYETLSLIEEDEERLDLARVTASELLPWDLRWRRMTRIGSDRPKWTHTHDATPPVVRSPQHRPD
ncbi:hypothetical protein [Amycolatopsis sp. NPDC054798]